MGPLGIWTALAVANFGYQLFADGDYRVAIERSFFQGFALLLVALLDK